jgi:hypothetical protein
MTDDKQIKFPEPEPCHEVDGMPLLSRVLDFLIAIGIGAILLFFVLYGFA